MTDLTTKARQALRDPMMRNSAALMSSTVVTSLLGYGFWLIVARVYGSEVNGTAAATTSAIQATVLIASVGAAAALVEWLPKCATGLEWRRRVTTGMTVSVLTAAVGGAVVVVALGAVSGTLPQLAQPAGALLFCLACVFFSAGIVIDYVAISEHRGGLLLVRNLVLCGLRIPLILIPVTALAGADSILLAWTVAAALSLVWAFATFGSRSGRSLRPEFSGLGAQLREMATSLVGQHLITVTAMLAGYLLPIIVYSRLSASDNAYFYITWMLGSVFFMISPAVSAALFVEGAGAHADMPRLARRSLLIIGALLTAPMLVYLAGGRLILGLFGEDYVAHGYPLLLLLTLSAIPDAVTNIAVAVLRITGRMRAALVLNGAMVVSCVVGAWLVVGQTGIFGAGVCWIVSQVVGAVWVLARWRRIVEPVPAGTVPAGIPGIVAADVAPVVAQGVDR
jgi:O-antigen/teichoic acid export membrane protein